MFYYPEIKDIISAEERIGTKKERKLYSKRKMLLWLMIISIMAISTVIYIYTQGGST
jgi:hypothetical protein